MRQGPKFAHAGNLRRLGEFRRCFSKAKTCRSDPALKMAKRRSGDGLASRHKTGISDGRFNEFRLFIALTGWSFCSPKTTRSGNPPVATYSPVDDTVSTAYCASSRIAVSWMRLLTTGSMTRTFFGIFQRFILNNGTQIEFFLTSVNKPLSQDIT
jgi:hypothetical protein